MNITIEDGIDIAALKGKPITVVAEIVEGRGGKPMLRAFYPSTLRREKRKGDVEVFRFERAPFGMRAEA